MPWHLCTCASVDTQPHTRTQTHVHARTQVANFGSQLLVMSSLKMPKRLTMHGDDECDHNFLVKGYEDLRKDQRIEQVTDGAK